MQTIAQQLREEGIKIGEKNMQTIARKLREEGKKEGKKEGKEEKAIETARRMLDKGFDLDTIAEITGLESSKIGKLVAITN